MALCDDKGEPLSNYRVRFLNVSELGPRKNLVGLLRAWLLATSRTDDALLIIKMSPFSAQRRALFEMEIELIQQALGKRLAEAAPVHFLRELYSDEQMPGLYAAATDYISVSHGEGWDQAMMEAAASGLRLIAPAHSAYLTYLDDSVARLVPSREVPVTFTDVDGLAGLFEGASWWEPDEELTVEALRDAIVGRARLLASADERVRRDFSWTLATQRLISILNEIAPPRKRRWPWRGIRLNRRL
jgi:glycosyltransferase involved in cell wall biosynthesis